MSSPDPTPRAHRADGPAAGVMPVVYAVLRLLAGAYLLAAVVLGGLVAMAVLPFIAALCAGQRMARIERLLRQRRTYLG